MPAVAYLSEKARAWTEANWRDDSSLDVMARARSVHRRTLRRHFKKAFGIPIVAAMVIHFSLPVVALAEDQAVEVGGGYSFGTFEFEQRENLPRGWFASVDIDLSQPLGIVAEMTGHSQSTSHDVGLFGTDESMRLYSVLAGPKGMVRWHNVVVSGDVLFGVTRLSDIVTSRVSLAGAVNQVVDNGQTLFDVAPGGGISVGLTRRWSVRLATDFHRRGLHPFAATAGAACRIR